MRGKDEQQLDVFSYVGPEQRVGALVSRWRSGWLPSPPRPTPPVGKCFRNNRHDAGMEETPSKDPTFPS